MGDLALAGGGAPLFGNRKGKENGNRGRGL